MGWASAIVWGVLACGLASGLAVRALAEAGWAHGAPLELRSGASLGEHVVGRVAPGERIDVLQSADGWSRVRTGEGKEGWLASELLDAVAPPRERVRQLEQEAVRLRAELAALRTEPERLSHERAGKGGERSAGPAQSLREHARFAAGERWADWLAGAGILGVGMTLGAILRGFSGGRRSSRIRL